MTTKRRTLLGAIATTVPLAGCAGIWQDVEDDVSGDGNDGDEDGSAGGADDDPRLDEADEVVTVGAEPDVEFDPDHLEIDTGTVVGFQWASSGHNIAVQQQPEDADWAGVPDTRNEGFVHIHTFDVEGRYDYYCEPDQEEDNEAEGQILVGNVEAEDLEGESEESDGGDGENATGEGADSDEPQSPTADDAEGEGGNESENGTDAEEFEDGDDGGENGS